MKTTSETNLNSNTESSGCQDFEAHPFRSRDIDRKGTDQTTTNCGNGTTNDSWRGEVASLGNDDTSGKCAQRIGNHVWNHVNSRLQSAGASNGLKPDWEVVTVNKHDSVDENC